MKFASNTPKTTLLIIRHLKTPILNIINLQTTGKKKNIDIERALAAFTNNPSTPTILIAHNLPKWLQEKRERKIFKCTIATRKYSMVRDFFGRTESEHSYDKSMKQLHTWILGGGQKVEHSHNKSMKQLDTYTI